MENTNKFRPDIFTPEVVDFVNNFANEYRRLRCPNYYGRNGIDFKIFYTGRIPCTPTGIRVLRRSRDIQIDRSVLAHELITENAMFFLLLWCVYKGSSKRIPSDIDCDKEISAYFRYNNIPLDDVYVAYRLILSMSASKDNAIRLRYMKTFTLKRMSIVVRWKIFIYKLSMKRKLKCEQKRIYSYDYTTCYDFTEL